MQYHLYSVIHARYILAYYCERVGAGWGCQSSNRTPRCRFGLVVRFCICPRPIIRFCLGAPIMCKYMLDVNHNACTYTHTRMQYVTAKFACVCVRVKQSRTNIRTNKKRRTQSILKIAFARCCSNRYCVTNTNAPCETSERQVENMRHGAGWGERERVGVNRRRESAKWN